MLCNFTNRLARWSYALPRQAAYRLSVANDLKRMHKLNSDDMKLLGDLWYHNFAYFGVPTLQEPGIWKANQACKEKILFPMIEEAVKRVRQRSQSSRGVELFCADGYYGLFAALKGAEHIHGMDLDEKNLKKAAFMSRILNLVRKTFFEKRDVYTMSDTYDFGICAGGLYHVADPGALLKLLSAHVKGPLVIQTVYSLAETSPEYFETPAPGWTWGCRFSYDHLKKLCRDAGWKIIREEKNELLGNKRPEDRGSAYLLCIPS